jgi:hypothetical protein
VVVSMHWRFIVLALIGAGAYFALLEVSYRFLESSYSLPPQWWFDHLHPQFMASVSWFVLIDALAAIVAAVPVAIGVVSLMKTRRLPVSLIIGVPSGLYIVGSGLVVYGEPKFVAAWAVDMFQFLSISLAVLLAVVLISSLPLTIVGRGRDA